MNKTKKVFEKIIKTDQTLKRLTNKKKEKTNYQYQ